MKRFESKVLKAIRSFSMLSENDSVICAVSGGPDSVALLLSLCKLKKLLSIKNIYVAHFNHMLREKAFEEEVFVKKLSESLNLPFFLKREDIKSLSGGRNIENTARERRMLFFRELSEKLSAKVATGHTKTDLSETVLMNLIKGSGLEGAKGFLPKRDFLIKPLIFASKEETESYLKELGQPFAVDESNFDTSFDRNFLRIKVFPLLKRLNPKVEDALERFAFSVQEASDYISGVVLKKLSLVKLYKNRAFIPESLLKEHPALLKPLFQQVFKRLSGSVLNQRKLESLMELSKGKTGGRLQLKDAFLAFREKRGLVIIKDLPFKTRLDIRSLPLKLGHGTLKIDKDGEPVDAELLEKGVSVRNWKEGDRTADGKSLKELFDKKSIPSWKRRLLPVLTYNNEVICVPGVYSLKEVKKPVYVRFELED